MDGHANLGVGCDLMIARRVKKVVGRGDVEWVKVWTILLAHSHYGKLGHHEEIKRDNNSMAHVRQGAL